MRREVRDIAGKQGTISAAAAAAADDDLSIDMPGVLDCSFARSARHPISNLNPLVTTDFR